VRHVATWTNVTSSNVTMVTKHGDACPILCGQINASHADAAARSNVLPKLVIAETA